MAFIKREIKDRVVQYPRRYQLVEVQPGIFDLIPVTGTVTEEGTPVNKELLQRYEDGLDAALEKTGDGKDVIVTFTEAATEAHIISGEKLSVMFGKILKMFKGKAPNSHASSATTYGVGTTANYGHCKTINGLTQSSHVDGNALSAYQGKVLNDKIPVVSNGVVTLTDTIPASTEITKTIPIGTNKKHAKVFIQPLGGVQNSLGIVLISNLTHTTGITIDHSGSSTAVRGRHSDLNNPEYILAEEESIYGVNNIYLTSAYISGSNLYIKLKNGATKANTLNANLAWEAW